MPNCDLSSIIQPPPISDMSPVIQPLEQVPTVPSTPISDTSIIQPTAQVPIVPSPPISEMSPIIQPMAQVLIVPSSPIFDTSIVQPMAQVPIVPSPPIFDTSILQPMAQVPIVPSPPIFDTSIVQPMAQVPIVPSPPIFDTSIIQPTAQVPTVPSPNITALNPQMDSSISFPGFAPNLNQTFFPTFDANPDESLMDLMSESLYSWPNQAQQGFGDQDLFNFSGLQDFSGMNNFNSDRSLHLPDMNVRLVLQGLQIFIHIHSSPLSHLWTATISTATLSQISTGCPTSTLTLRLMPTPCLTSL
jgi:hypothetical protein